MQWWVILVVSVLVFLALWVLLARLGVIRWLRRKIEGSPAEKQPINQPIGVSRYGGM